MARNINDIFNECLERMQQGESLESCLSSYPEHADDLQALLRTYLNVRWRGSMPQPNPQFREQARAQFIYALQQSQQAQWEKQQKPAKSPLFQWHGALVPTVAAVLLMLFSGVGTVAASTDALPDQPLYPVKIAAERAREVLAFSDEDKAKLHVALVETRVQEITKLTDQGKTAYIPVATANLVDHLDKADLAIKRVEVAEVRQANRTTAPATLTAPSVAPVIPAPQAPSMTAPVPPQPLPEGSKQLPLPDSSGKSGAGNISAGVKIDTKKTAELKDILDKSLSRNVPALEKLLDKAPLPAVRSAIQNAIDVSNVKRQQNNTKDDDQDRNSNRVNPPKTQGDEGKTQPSGITVPPAQTLPPPKPPEIKNDSKTVPNPLSTIPLPFTTGTQTTAVSGTTSSSISVPSVTTGGDGKIRYGDDNSAR